MTATCVDAPTNVADPSAIALQPSPSVTDAVGDDALMIPAGPTSPTAAGDAAPTPLMPGLPFLHPICVGDCVIPTIDVDGVLYAEIKGTTAVSRWLCEATGTASTHRFMSRLRKPNTFTLLSKAIESSRGNHSRFSRLVDNRGAALPLTMQVSVPERGIDSLKVGNTSWPLQVEASIENMDKLRAALIQDVMQVADGGDESGSTTEFGMRLCRTEFLKSQKNCSNNGLPFDPKMISK